MSISFAPAIAPALRRPAVVEVLDRVEDRLELGAERVRDAFLDGALKAVGYLELTGLRYPVKHYEAQVAPGLWRGSRLENAQQFAALKDRGFRAIVDLTREGTKDASLAPAAGLRTLNLPILDNDHPTLGQMKRFLDFVTSPENQPSYVHCEAGKGRTGVAVACYRMAVQGWPLEQALREAKGMGMAAPNQEAFLRMFDVALTTGRIPGYSR